MSEPSRCPRCESPLEIGTAGSFCPRCLLQLAREPAGEESAIDSQESTADLSAVTPPAGPMLADGQHFGPYEIVRKVGQGGMGEVYEVEETETGRRVALKLVRDTMRGGMTTERFLREGSLAASINHPHSVFVFGTGEVDGRRFIAMEFSPGGTLEDRVRRQGPLPWKEAVEAILEVVAGLEAAHAAGILHRDVKPSNCFLGADGRVKIGDFGLSIPEGGDSELTAQGAVLGTPAYSSPEQLRGKALDIRSDIYSVGATLYYLLTGRPPFQGRTLVELIGAILEGRSSFDSASKATVPRGLAKVALKALTRHREDRFADYRELRRALEPFGAAPSTLGDLGLRTLAFGLDGLAVNLSGTVAALASSAAFEVPLVDAARASAFFTALLATLYFSLGEGVFGATPGKALLGLRVVRPDGSPIDFACALRRAGVFVTVFYGPGLVELLVSDGMARSFVAADPFSATTWIRHAVAASTVAALFSTARRRNRYAALHDLAGDSRVVPTWEPAGRRVSLDLPRTEPGPGSRTETTGPFRVVGRLWTQPDCCLDLGHDEALDRSVWILRRAAGRTSRGRRNLSRPTRLRWLAGREDSTGRWDAFEAPDGAAWSIVVRAQPTWKAVRYWLLDLAEEYAAAEHDADPPPVLAADRIWIRADGRAMILDFPVPAEEAFVDSAATDAMGLLSRIARWSLDGRPAAAARATELPETPLPLHARTLLERLSDRAFSRIADVAETLRQDVRRPTEVTRGRRFVSLAGAALPFSAVPMIFVSTLLVTPWIMNRVDRLCPRFPELQYSVEMLHLIERGRAGTDVSTEEIQALETLVTAYLSPGMLNPQSFDEFLLHSMLGGTRVLRVAERTVQGRAPSSDEALMRAREILQEPILRRQRSRDAMRHFDPRIMRSASLATLTTAAFVAFAALLTSFLFRGGLFLRASGLALVRKDGSPVSRGRALSRCLIAWSPVLLVGVPMFVGTTSTLVFGPQNLPELDWFDALLRLAPWLFALVVIGYAWIVVVPDRGLHDRITGTVVVPI